MQIRSFAEAHDALRQFYGASAAGSRTLERMQALMKYLGNPQDTLQIVHVAGTSGKTSTCYYTAASLHAAGAKVGLTVSPHVDEVNERVQIDLTPMAEREFCAELSEFVGLVRASGLEPSYFEVMMAFAFWEFARQQVDYAVVEVGLGGLLDGSNVVSRADKVCVITDIGLDHTDILGDTLAKIATQKAGIIQPDTHAFMYTQGGEVTAAVRERADGQHATLREIAPQKPWEGSSLPLFQQRNFYLAQQAVDYVLARDGRTALTPSQVAAAARTRVPARMEQFHMHGKTVVIDGSHNSQKLGVLAESLRDAYPHQSIAALVSFVQDKDERWQRGLDALLPLVGTFIVTAYAADQDMPKQSMAPEKVAAYCRAQGATRVIVEPDSRAAFTVLLQQPEPILLVAGSFYLLAHIRPLIAEDEAS